MTAPFPCVEKADSNGLIAYGGELSPAQVWLAHQSGIFPWFSHNNPILWWAPNPRGVLFTQQIHISRSLKKAMRQLDYEIRFDSDFDAVIYACATLHGDTWISKEMRQTYTRLHQQGRAHSCELWQNGTLIGGLYGVCLNKVFCAESMFSAQPNASKIVLVHLCHYLTERDIATIDVQFLTPHLASMGAVEIPRQEYMRLLVGDADRLTGRWKMG